VLLKSSPKKRRPHRKTARSIVEESPLDIPAPVVLDDDGDGASRLADKEAMISGGGVEEPSLDEVESNAEPKIIDEELLDEIDALESEEESHILEAIEERRRIDSNVRARLAGNRRVRLSKVRAGEAKRRLMVDSREDLVKVIEEDDGHIVVFDEPEHPPPGAAYAGVLVRINDEHILRLRRPLSSMIFERPRIQIETTDDEETDQEDSRLSDLKDEFNGENDS